MESAVNWLKYCRYGVKPPPINGMGVGGIGEGNGGDNLT